MLLGALLERLSTDDAAATLAALDDPILAARIDAAAARFDETFGEYVSNASGRFAAFADGEAWLAVTTAMERSRDPGRAALAAMLRWALAEDARADIAEGEESCGSACSCGEGHARA
jgi:hypothetical protein